MELFNTETGQETPNDSKTSGWNRINWEAVTRQVRTLQTRIVKAMKQGKMKQVRSLQRLLTHSTAAKLLAVRRVTSNRGKRTAGVDGILWNTPEAKYAAAMRLRARGYSAKPLRRVYIPKSGGKTRMLGIPTMYDRAMQALYRLALDPVAEHTADTHSYGFRPCRSVADAIAQCFTVLCHKGSARYILEGDIQRCFDEISHPWLEAHIPLDTKVLREWLRSGAFEGGVVLDTMEGTPQGGIISPTLCNMTLDGIERLLEEHFRRRGTTWLRRCKVHFVRYADDFIITGATKEILEHEVMPVLKAFLAERGLRLSEKKTRITDITDGFHFLGFHLRKYHGKLLIRPSGASVKKVLKHIRHLIKKHKTMETGKLIDLLNPVIRGWAYAYRHVVSSQIFHALDSQIWTCLWNWTRRRHRHKRAAWLKAKYFRHGNGTNWCFSDGKDKYLYRMSSLTIRRHLKIKGECNPYDPAWEPYLEQLRERRLPDCLQSIEWLKLYLRQDGQCPYCGGSMAEAIDTEDVDMLCVHHVVPLSQGGKDTLNNKRLLHDVCHRQLHALHEEEALLVAAELRLLWA
jgi:RNA-directed DNA polymerase